MSAILNVLKYIPASTARKALEKVNPGFKNYFAKSAAYGLDINRAIDFLSDRFQSESQKSHKAHLAQGKANRTLRPDELASKAQIENAEMPLRAAKTAASLVGGALLGREPSDKTQAAKPSTGPVQGPQQFEGLNLQHGPFQKQEGPMGPQQRYGMQHGPFQEGPERQKHGPFEKLSSKIQPSSREEATRQYNAMKKDKNLMNQLKEDFQNRYGEQQTQDPDMQALLQALQQLNQSRGG